jgi:hypothetical protein
MAAVRSVLPRAFAVLLGAIARWLLVVIGLVFFVVPGVFFWLAFFAVTPVIVLEGKPADAALRRSWVLSRGLKGKIFVTWLIVFIIFVVLSFGVGILSFGAMAGGLFGLSQVLSALVNILVYPFAGIITALLYYDARIQKEGFDIDHMAQSLAAAAAPPTA